MYIVLGMHKNIAFIYPPLVFCCGLISFLRNNDCDYLNVQ